LPESFQNGGFVPLNFNQLSPMKTIEIYDPAMCCQTGVCGNDIDPKLIQFASDLEWLKQQGVSVSRFNLAQQPAAFAASGTVNGALKSFGTDCLPLLLVDGAIATRSIYPTRDQLASLAGVEASAACCADDSAESEECCGGSGESCCS
jgi:hypothetical protein